MCPTSFPWWMFPVGLILGLIISYLVVRALGRLGVYLLFGAAFVMAVVVMFSLGKLQAAGCVS